MTISAELRQAGLMLHGHKCPAMPMALKVALAALKKLGVERAKAEQLMALVELGGAHCATCFADGIQMATSATFGNDKQMLLQQVCLVPVSSVNSTSSNGMEICHD